MKNIIKIIIGKMKASIGLRKSSPQDEYTRLIEKFDVVKEIPLSVTTYIKVKMRENQ